MSTDKHLRCNFCGKSKGSVEKFISGPNVYICNECVALCNEILAEYDVRAEPEGVVSTPTPHEIKEALDRYVIGQEEAKKTIAVAVYNHYKRVTHDGLLDGRGGGEGKHPPDGLDRCGENHSLRRRSPGSSMCHSRSQTPRH